MPDNFSEWEKEFTQRQIDDNDWGHTGLTVGENRTLLKTMLEMRDDQEICNFVIIAQVHNANKHCKYEEHRGIFLTSLETEDVISFVLRAIEQL